MHPERLSPKRLSRRRLVTWTGQLAGATALAASVVGRDGPQSVAARVQAAPPDMAAAARAAHPTAFTKPNGWAPTIPAPPVRYDPPLTVSQNFPLNPAIQFTKGETIEDNVWSRWFKEVTGISYEPAWVAKGEEAIQQKWGTTLASGDLPEYLFALDQDVYGRLLKADRLEDITEIWERVASPLVKEKKEYPGGALWRQFRGGRVHAIPGSVETGSNDALLWIRQDWLDKAGKQPPTTLDELADVARAFVGGGFGPVGIALGNDLVASFGGLDPVFGAFGAMPGRWLKGADGKLVYGGVQPGVKDALGVLRGWFADGLIEPEFVTKDFGKVGETIAANRTGIFFGPYWVPGYPLIDSQKNDPNATWVVFDVPAGPSGRRGRAGSQLGLPLQAFRKGVDAKKVEAVIQDINWRTERWTHSFANHDYFYQGFGMQFEGYDYVWEGDTVQVGPVDLGTVFYEGGGGINTWLYPNVLFDYIDQLGAVEARPEAERNAMEQYLTRDPVQAAQRQAYSRMFETLEDQIPNEFVGAPTPTMIQAGATLEKLEDEAFIGIVTGQRPVEDFDVFVEQWTKQGGATITDEVNAWASGG